MKRVNYRGLWVRALMMFLILAIVVYVSVTTGDTDIEHLDAIPGNNQNG